MSSTHPRAAGRCRRLAVVAALGAAAGLTAIPGTALGATGPTTRGPGGGFGPGVVGSVAAIGGTSMEVQNPDTGQTTVDWTSSTTFTQTVTVSLSSVTVGDCVTVTGKTAKKKITATSVSVTQPSSSGTCTTTGFGGIGGPGGAGGPVRFHQGAGTGGRTFTPPSGGFSKTGPPRGGGVQRPTDFGFASGKVTAVAGTSITVHGISSAALTSKAKKTTKNAKTAAVTTAKTTKKKTTSKKSSAGGAQLTPSTFTVAVSSATTYTEEQSAAASNLAVGDCVSAVGKAATNGTVTATTVRITSTGGGTCTGGFTFSTSGQAAGA